MHTHTRRELLVPQKLSVIFLIAVINWEITKEPLDDSEVFRSLTNREFVKQI